MDKEIKNKIDELFYSTGRYQNGSEFMKLLDFCKKFHYLAPYNAMLVHMQRPGAIYVNTASWWLKKYNMRVKPTARPLIILVPFGPVDYVFDADDIEGDYLSYLPEEILNPFKTEGKISVVSYNNLLNNLKYFGIRFEKIAYGTQQHAKIELLKNPSYNGFNITNKKIEFKINLPEYYLITVNNKSDREAIFAAVAHELAHFFCEHLIPPHKVDWWNVRVLNHKEEEFEAETVAWLICERHGIKNPSAKYLSEYLDGSKVPNISLENVLKATNKIEALLLSMNINDGLLAKKDETVKKQLQEIKKKTTKNTQQKIDYN